MSQYDRHGAGMNCSGRNQFDITKEDVEELRKQLSQRRKSHVSSSPTTIDSGLLSDMWELFKDKPPTKEAVKKFFSEHPEARIVTVGGCITKNGFEPTNT